MGMRKTGTDLFFSCPAHRSASIPEDSPGSTQNHGVRRTPVGDDDRAEQYGGKTGHNHPGLSWHKHLLASETQIPFCALPSDINRSAKRVGSDANQRQAIRKAAKINLSRFSYYNEMKGRGKTQDLAPAPSLDY